jgi:4'-phosphopantetheinyl transferase
MTPTGSSDLPDWSPLTPDLTLLPNHVHLFLAPTALSQRTLAHLETFLTDAERQRVARLRIAAKRDEALISRALLRRILSRFLGTPPRDICFATNPHGKPYLDHFPLHFNLSHTAGYILLGVSLDLEIGVDIESLRADLAHEELAERFFTPAEYAALVALSPAARPLGFFRCWSRKEALVKATGRGIAFGLDTFEVPLRPLSGPTAVSARTLHDIPLPATHTGALATGSPDAELHFWRCNSLFD